MAMKKVKQGLAAALAAALVLQGAPMPVQAAQDAGAAVQGETVPGGEREPPKRKLPASMLHTIRRMK